MKALKILALVLVIVLGLAVFGLTLKSYVEKRVNENNYSRIQIGDSKQELVRLYGEPDEITDCSNYKKPSYIEAVRRDCVEVYWYRAFLEQWIFFFDKDGKVVHKAFNTSY